MRILTPVVAAMALMAVCSTGEATAARPHAAAASAPRHPASGLPVVPLSVVHKGQVHAFQVEVARTDAEQERGLMFRTAMGANEGMIFPMSPPRPASFWMRNTVLPLDILFIGPDHRVLNIAANAVPYSETPLYSAGPVSAVLELNGGRAAQLGIVSGDKVRW